MLAFAVGKLLITLLLLSFICGLPFVYFFSKKRKDHDQG